MSEGSRKRNPFISKNNNENNTKENSRWKDLKSEKNEKNPFQRSKHNKTHYNNFESQSTKKSSQDYNRSSPFKKFQESPQKIKKEFNLEEEKEAFPSLGEAYKLK